MLVTTTSPYESALMIATIYKRAQDGWPTKLTQGLRRPELRWSTDSRVQRLMVLWPHLREATATTLMGEFDTIGAILDVARNDPKRLLAVDGVGKQGLANLLTVLS